MARGVFGRDAEIGAVDAVLASARQGFTALVLEGDPGIGKTTVWRQGIAHATDGGYRVLSCRTAPTEVHLSFAALCDLLAPIEATAFQRLAEPQRRALEAALLRSESTAAAPNPRAIGTGLVSLLAQLAGAAPVLLAIDDLQWLDAPSAHALEFALRRLEPHPIAVLATVRSGERGRAPEPLATGRDERVHRLRLGPLSLGALYRIVEDDLGHGLPRPLLVKIELAAGGNPFYVLEIARALEADRGRQPGEELPIPDSLRELAANRLRKLPRRTRDALLRVSALARPTIALVDPAALAPAEEAGVVQVHGDGRIELAHPLFAGAIYAAASYERRRTLHGELAEIVEDVEERARHLMLTRADHDTDEHVASVLHEAAEHARRRGAVEVAAELEEQSARRTPPPQFDVRWRRSLRAARHYQKAGDPARSKALCQEVLDETPPPSVRVQALGLLAEVCVNESPPTAIPVLEEALACAGDDVGKAAQLEVALGVVRISVFDLLAADRHLVRAVELAERAGDSALLAEAIALKANSGLFTGQGLDERALERALALEDPEREVPFQMRVSMNVAQAYEFVLSLDRSREVFLNLRDRLVARGEESDLPWVLSQLGAVAVLAGEIDASEQYTSDAERIAALTGVEVFRAFALSVRAWARAMRGDLDGARADGTEAIAVSERIGWAIGVGQSRSALGFLALSESNPESAVALLEPLATAVESIGVYEYPIAMSLPDAIEAFIATGARERAARLTNAFNRFGRDFNRPWALARSGRCRALLEASAGDLDAAMSAVEQALVDHEHLPMPFELGRTLLVQGQLQRRRGERKAARDTFQRALAIFTRLGTSLWAEKAAAEIARIGVRRAPEGLTEGEMRVAELAAQGLSNSDIAARLFMSRRTVEANLSRAYGKLGIRSRAELGATMAKRRAPAGS